MSMRAPSTPSHGRTLSIQHAGSMPSSTARRKSGLPMPGSAIGRPGSALSSSSVTQSELSSLQAALRAHPPPTSHIESPDGSDSPTLSTMANVTNTEATDLRKRTLRKPSTSNLCSGSAASAMGVGVAISTPVDDDDDSAAYDGLAPRTPTASTSSQRFAGPLPIVLPPAAAPKLQVGSRVTFEVNQAQMEGILRFMGEVDGKAGKWAGVELVEQWVGQGKNDGTVKGVQYFACPPVCGLFMPLSKVTALPPPKPAVAAARPRTSGAVTPGRAGITVGSRASKYVGVTAKDLAAKKTLGTSTSGPLSPSKGSFATPRAVRPRISNVGLPTPTPRKSIGAATPRAAAAATTRRPPSALRVTNPVPDVPPIPAGRRSVTPSLGGRVTPSGRATPGTAMTPSSRVARRMSSISNLGSSTASQSAFAMSPNGRSQSRQSFSSSVTSSRMSHYGGDTEEVGQGASTHLRSLLDASEKLGRELEDKLAEKEANLRAAEAKLAVLEGEREKDKARESERLTSASDLEGQLAQERDTVETLSLRVAELEAQSQLAVSAREKQARDHERQLNLRQAELEKATAHAQAVEDEKADAEAELDTLREAGLQLCSNYEEKLAVAETARQEQFARAEALEAELAAAAVAAKDASAPMDRLAMSTASAADVIDAESAQAELDHLRGRVAKVEEQLANARREISAEIDEKDALRAQHADAVSAFKKEIAVFKAEAERLAKSEKAAAEKVLEVEEALIDTQTALENERAELEGLRSEAQTNGSTSKELSKLQSVLQSTTKDLDRARKEAEAATKQANDLREDLRAAEKELDKLQSQQSGAAHAREKSMTSEQISDYEEMLATLRADNTRHTQRNAELLEESQTLKDAQRALEATVENLMGAMDSPADKEAADALKAQLKDAETRLVRETKLFKQEVSELESLLESKIYREAELEAQIEDLRDSVSRAKSAGYVSDSNGRPKSVVSLANGPLPASESEEDGCEMCGNPDHTVDACPLFGNSLDLNSSKSRPPPGDDPRPWCDDCEEYGHDLQDCPMADEIF